MQPEGQAWLMQGRIFTGEAFVDGHALVIEGGIVRDIVRATSDAPDGATIVPGFVDLQVNGGGGVLFNEMPTVGGATTIAQAHRRLGTTSILPTAITDRPEVMLAAAEAAAEASRHESGVVGVHLEGPFLSRERKGAHPEAYLRAPDPVLVEALAALAGRSGTGRVMITLAPECVTDGDIRRLASAGAIVSGGHSAASLERTHAAIAAGLRGFTHLFNAMPPIASRAPGIALAAMTDPSTVCGIIADGVHVHPSLLLHAIACKPPGQVVLVSDAMPTAGTQETRFVLGGRTVQRRDGRLTLEDGTLAGADLDLARAVRNAVSWGVPLDEALRMASLYPARLLGIEATRGRLMPGCRADLVVLDPSLVVCGVWFGGRQV